MTQHTNIVEVLADELGLLREQKKVLEKREDDVRVAILNLIPDRSDAIPDVGHNYRTMVETHKNESFQADLPPDMLRLESRYRRSVALTYTRAVRQGTNGGNRPPAS